MMMRRPPVQLLMVIGWMMKTSMGEAAAIDTPAELASESQLTVIREPQNETVFTGGMVELHCEVFGTPITTVRWLHNGKPVRPVGNQHRQQDNAISSINMENLSNRGLRTFQMSTTSSKLHIPCVDASHAGVYTCQASNGKESVRAHATLHVIEKGNSIQMSTDCSQNHANYIHSGISPNIYMWTDSRMERPGVAVQLMCRADGTPKPKITWYERIDADGNGRTRIAIDPTDDRFMLLSNGDLLIKKLPELVPLSIFQCEATNQFGKDTVTSMLLEIIDDTEGPLVDNSNGKRGVIRKTE